MIREESKNIVQGLVLQNGIVRAIEESILKYNTESGLVPKKIVIENIPYLIGGEKGILTFAKLENQVEFSISLNKTWEFDAKKLGETMGEVIRSEITKQQKPGGLLSK